MLIAVVSTREMTDRLAMLCLSAYFQCAYVRSRTKICQSHRRGTELANTHKHAVNGMSNAGKQIWCRSVCATPSFGNRLNIQTKTHTGGNTHSKANSQTDVHTNPRLEFIQKHTHTHTPDHQFLWCLRSQWAAQTCGSSWWTPRDRLPGSGSYRSVTCCSPAESRWTDRAPCLPCSRRCAWKRWWSRDLWWPPCSRASWSSGGFRPGFRQDWESVQSSWEGEWRSPEACLQGKKRTMWFWMCSTAFDTERNDYFKKKLEERRGEKWWSRGATGKKKEEGKLEETRKKETD